MPHITEFLQRFAALHEKLIQATRPLVDRIESTSAKLKVAMDRALPETDHAN